jgi:geranylgeranyl pyrophosphate synthase
MDFKAQFSAYLTRVEGGLKSLVPAADTPPARLHEAMRYSLEAGGKRLRPVLALAAADLFGNREDALPSAIALECIHTYSLIHDDLPCMDNDDLRRGRPTAHKAFDEATALLAGDALLTHAFALLAEAYAPSPALVGALVRELGSAAGSRRLIGGQMADLLAEKDASITVDGLEFIHLNKTAAMIEASLTMGALCGGAAPAQVESLRKFGRHLGLAFQIIDDVLDVTSDSATLGKTAGKDEKAQKSTYVKLHGLEAARRMAQEQTAAALTELREIPGNSAFLQQLALSMASRLS